MNTAIASPPALASDLTRMLRLAPLFDVNVLEDPDSPEHVVLHVLDADGERKSRIPRNRLERRLLAELGAKTVRWVYYHPGVSCREALLSQTDSRLQRLGQLYAKWKSEGFPG